MFLLIYAWTNSWVNNGDAGDLRRHRADYDVTVKMYILLAPGTTPTTTTTTAATTTTTTTTTTT